LRRMRYNILGQREMGLNPANHNITDGELLEFFEGPVPYGSGLGFYLDESVSQRVAVGLVKNYGIDITRVEEEGQKAEPSDILILARAREMGRILVTVDRHFRSIHNRVMRVKGTNHAGIIWIRSREARQDPAVVRKFIIELAEVSFDRPDVLENRLVQV
jgi:predicted nuclease of predicted toxin-antitoxin system